MRGARLVRSPITPIAGVASCVTKRGRPVAWIVPIVVGVGKTLQGSLSYEEGLLDPVDVERDATK